MFRAGDEFMNTQRGEGNPYNKDDVTVWLDWRRLDVNADIFRFFKKMIHTKVPIPVTMILSAYDDGAHADRPVCLPQNGSSSTR
jgi:pullulanase/glycogen debranching enzyme